MNYIKTLSILLSCTLILAGCQSKKMHQDDAAFQCVPATIMVGGKPVATVIQWNTKTGMTRIIDSIVMTSKATGAQNALVGWVGLNDLNVAVQEAVTREQALLQRQQQRQQQVSASSTAAAAKVATPTKSKK